MTMVNGPTGCENLKVLSVQPMEVHRVSGSETPWNPGVYAVLYMQCCSVV